MHCEGLQDFPHRGMRRDDVRHGLCITSYKSAQSSPLRSMQKWVSFSGFYYGGKDYASALLSELDEYCDKIRMTAYGAGLRRYWRNRENFPGVAVEDDGHVFVAGVERQEAYFGFVEGLGG